MGLVDRTNLGVWVTGSHLIDHYVIGASGRRALAVLTVKGLQQEPYCS